MDEQAPADGPFPGDGGWGSAPARVLEAGFDLDEHFARLVRQIDAGRLRTPLAGSVGSTFGQDGAADVLRPGPVLASLTAQAVASAGSLADDELISALHAARRMANLADYQAAPTTRHQPPTTSNGCQELDGGEGRGGGRLGTGVDTTIEVAVLP